VFPIPRDTNKIYILEKKGLMKKKVALVGAGTDFTSIGLKK
jgi:hypothetical protein